MLDWLLVGAGATAIAVAAGSIRRSRAHRRWREVFAEAASLLSGRVSSGSTFTPPELRCEVGGVTVTLRVDRAHEGLEGVRLEAVARIPGDRPVRSYIGWDIGSTPNDLSHVAEVHLPRTQRLDGLVALRAEDKAALDAFLAAHTNDLLDLRRETAASELEIMTRGGYVTVRVQGAIDTPYLMERLASTTARFARWWADTEPSER